MLRVHCKSLLILHLLVICLSAVDSKNSTRILVISNEEVTWIEGQSQCAEKNGRLLSSDDFSLYLQEVLEKVSGDFWLGDIQKVSEWIHILGCYSKASIENDLSSPINFTIALTPGRCQEHCFYEKFALYFAIKEETCYCLKSDFNLPSTTSVTNCDYNCNSEEPRTCGSKTGQYLSVYKTANTSDKQDKGMKAICMSIQCSTTGVKKYKPDDCTIPMIPYCSNDVVGTGKNWAGANAECLIGKGYLDGEANLDDPTTKCNEIQNRFPNSFQFWIGIRRQVYKSMDKGYQIELTSLESCDFFAKRNPATMQTNCSKKLNAVCLVPKNISKTGPPTADEKREKGDGISTASTVIISIISTLFAIILVCVVVIIVLYKRKRKKAHNGKEQTDNIPQDSAEDPRFYDQLGDTNDDHTYHKINSSRNDSNYQELHVYKNTEFVKSN